MLDTSAPAAPVGGATGAPHAPVARRDLAYRDVPEQIVLAPHPGVVPSTRPPVRIFLGTEDAQYRAERVFIFSIDKYRDPSRTYVIHLMKNMRGFRRGGWRTHFTNYRFAIPDWAGRGGKAIYNDVDQIYLADPAALFDLDLGGHGYRSVSPEDTSVMLLDCKRMAPWWSLERAATTNKRALLTEASRQAGLWGVLDSCWNARDLEYDAARSKCQHFTLLHTQPWTPSPDQCSYHPHPLGDIWFSLEQEADARGFRPFDQSRPSARFADALEAAQRGVASVPRDADGSGARLVDFVSRYGATTILACSLRSDPAGAIVTPAGAVSRPFTPTPDGAWPSEAFDAAIVTDTLEHLPSEDVPWMLTEIFARARSAVAIRVAATAAEVIYAPALDDPCLCMRPVAWWREQITAAARGRVAWHLETFIAGAGSGLPTTLEAKSVAQAGEPRVWVLLGAKGGDNAQAMDLAIAVGWKYEAKQLKFNLKHVLPTVLVGGSLASLEPQQSASLEPPWPDIVISAGKRSVPAARWIAEQSGGRTKLVHIGRPWAPFAWFDLIITTPQYRLPARPNVLHNTLPLHSVDRKRLVATPDFAHWRQRVAPLPRPYTVLLVGGDSPSYVLAAATAARLGVEAATVARANGGSLLVVTSSRTSAGSADALEAAIDCPHHFHRFRAGAPENPYRAFLALADRFIVTGDSASMLAEACAMGLPVAIYPVPLRLESLPGSKLLRHGIWQWRRSRTSYRGTPKQQDWLARVYDGLVDTGLVTPARDLGAYHERLRAEGLATVGLDANAAPPRPRRRLDDMEKAVERLRSVWTTARPVGEGGLETRHVICETRVSASKTSSGVIAAKLRRQ